MVGPVLGKSTLPSLEIVASLGACENGVNIEIT